MYSSVKTAQLFGLNCVLTTVEVDTTNSLPGFEMVGLLGSEVRESRERVRVALRNSGTGLPPIKITVSITPADIRKEGSGYDLPIAIGIMVSLGQIPVEYIEDILIVGELGLNGEVKQIKGVLPIVASAVKMGYKRCMVPVDNAIEGGVIAGIEVIGVRDFAQALEYFSRTYPNCNRIIEPIKVDTEDLLISGNRCGYDKDFAQVNGREGLKRAAVVAASGLHHILITGPPGSGKTMIASRIPSILPSLTLDESLEVTSIYSVSGRLDADNGLITTRPFISPHHTISPQALVGGGRIPTPGALSHAHKGVLFLDELPEFSREALDAMRQPLEDKVVNINRVQASYTYPADFMLVAAMNPCPCGYYPDMNRCSCPPARVYRYNEKISGPIMDRIDINLRANPVKLSELRNQEIETSSAILRDSVLQAVERQKYRYRNIEINYNSELTGSQILEYAHLGDIENRLVEKMYSSMQLSARAYHKIIKVARTIADIEGSENVLEEHLHEAMCYRRDGG